MAVDTRAKRQSALRASGGIGLPNPDGTVAEADRRHLLGQYGGILAAVLAAIVLLPPHVVDAPARTWKTDA